MHSNDDPKRAGDFARNPQLEKLLASLNSALVSAENQLLVEHPPAGSGPPPVFLFGPLRSGTTLFIQWLASTGAFSYPTNLLSRFYNAPLVGALIQQMLTDQRYRFRDELKLLDVEINFDSQNGKTSGAMSPNEFWYFWRRFLPSDDILELSSAELLRSPGISTLAAEVRSLAAIFSRPFVMKAMILNFHIPFLRELFPEAIFVQLRRDPVANTASALAARVRQFGTESTWYSFRVPQYEKLQALSPTEQCAGQVLFTNRAIEQGMSAIPETGRIVVDYENFCADPAAVYKVIMERLPERWRRDYSIDVHFSPTREVSPSRAKEITAALRSVAAL